jgi:hypothetical protein
MTEKVEGTLVLEGLLEAPRPETPGFNERIQEWLQLLKQAGLDFSIETEGSSFNLLAPGKPIRSSLLGPTPETRIQEALQQLLKLLPPPLLARVTSTLRSVEYRRGAEIQTVFQAHPDGRVECHRRTAAAETVPPPAPLTRKELLRRFLVGAVLLAVLLGISSFFVDYGAMFRAFRLAVSPFKAEDIELEIGPFAPYFTVEQKRVVEGRALRIRLKRTPAYPLKPEDFDRAIEQAGRSTEARLALEALARGHVRTEYYGDKGEFYASRLLRLRELREKEALDLLLPLDTRPRTKRIVLAF